MAYIPTPRGTYMSLEDWVKIIGYVATGVLIVVRIWVWHLKRKRKKHDAEMKKYDEQKLALERELSIQEQQAAESGKEKINLKQ